VRKTLLLFLVTLSAAIADSPQTPTTTNAAQPAAELSIADATILGIVEGVTEYLPVSSTGHLIIANHALGLDADQPLRGKEGQELWYKKPSPKHPDGEALTLKLAADTFTVVIQFGAIAAVALLYWRQIRSLFLGLFGRDPEGCKLLRNLLLAFFPAAVIGLVLHDWIDAHFSVPVVIAAQIVGAVVILWAEAYRRNRPSNETASELTPRQALGIGTLQCFALWPGMSRSMTTIVGGYLCGLDPRRSAEFSFLLGFITLSAATVFKSYKSGAAMIEVFGWSHVLLGCIVATITAAVAVKFLVGWLSRHGMAIFAYYRLAFAALLAWWIWVR